MYFLVYSCVDFFTHLFRACFSGGIGVQYGGFPCRKHACNAAMSAACTVPESSCKWVYLQLHKHHRARSKLKNSHTCTVQYQDVKEQIIQFREIKGFSVLGRYHFAVVTKQDQSESLLSKITSSKLLNNICNIQ